MKARRWAQGFQDESQELSAKVILVPSRFMKVGLLRALDLPFHLKRR